MSDSNGKIGVERGTREVKTPEAEMIYTESIRGYPYMPKDKIAQEFSLGKSTVQSRVKEIETQIKEGRYNDYAVIRDGGIVLINVLVFIDYLEYRKRLRDKNAKKYVPEFQPEKIVHILGWNNRIVQEDAG
ncbi:MAG: hypothetical protein HFH56_06115 [Lachnospiraceae bacterium]|jgi:hypothetical protein|nr:hypothetical protein [Lachnospiraceae bacterium]MCI9470775.1 hypothetical protein [Lachnospiraceae bacterium]